MTIGAAMYYAGVSTNAGMGADIGLTPLTGNGTGNDQINSLNVFLVSGGGLVALKDVGAIAGTIPLTLTY